MIDYQNDIRIILIVSILQRVQANNLDTEAKKQQFLYDLAKLNSLAAKGYRVEKTTLDQTIYNVKQIACEFLATAIPDRCRYYDSGFWTHTSVLYVYAKKRQYSFHVDLPSTIQVAKAREDEWDHVEGGWQLTDAEYREARAASRQQESQGIPVRSADDRRRAMMCIAAAKEYRYQREHVNEFCEQAREKFWQELSEVLPAAKKKNKCFAEKNLDACFSRYFDLIKTSFTLDERRFLMAPLCYEYFQEDYFLRKFDDSTSQAVHSIVEMLDHGKMSAEKLYRVIH